MPTVKEAAHSGDRLAALIELRDLIAQHLDLSDSARDVAALSRQLTDVLSQIESITAAGAHAKGTPLDELANRRAAREPDAARPHRSGAGVVGRP